MLWGWGYLSVFCKNFLNRWFLGLIDMPRSRRRHRSRSHSRSHSPASPQYDHKRRRVDYDSPQSKGTYR